MIAYCENPNCKTIFSNSSIFGGSGALNIKISDVKIGPCPNCGSMGIVPDGVYNYINNSISFIRSTKESIENLLEVKKLLINYKDNPKPKEEVISEVNKISPEYAKTIEKETDIDYHKWISTIIAILTVAILIHQSYFKGNDKEISDKIIEQLLNQNKTLIENSIIKTQNSNIKQNRNDKCHCNSGLKFKKCCLINK